MIGNATQSIFFIYPAAIINIMKVNTTHNLPEAYIEQRITKAKRHQTYQQIRSMIGDIEAEEALHRKTAQIVAWFSLSFFVLLALLMTINS